MNWGQQPFFQVALPIIITFAIATWFQSKRIDDLRDSLNRRMDAIDRRLDAIERRLERIENLLTDHDRRITVLEERTSPLHR
jgi:F0F1-type ATP synthase membrane subunit b/b'